MTHSRKPSTQLPEYLTKLSKRNTIICVLALVAPASTHAAPPAFDPANLSAYRIALARSHDPDAARTRREIADGPAALASAMEAATAAGIVLGQPPAVPSDQNALTYYKQWAAVRGDYPKFADPLSLKYQYTPEQIAAAQNVVDDHPDADALLDKALATSILQFPTESLNAFPDYASMREITRQIMTEATLLDLKGEVIPAVTKQSQGFKLNDQFEAQSNIIKFLVSGVIEGDTVSGLQRILGRSPPDITVTSAVENSGIAEEDDTLLARVVKGEAAANLNICKSYPTLAIAATDSNEFSPHLAQTLLNMRGEDLRFATHLYDSVMAVELNDELVDMKLVSEFRMQRRVDLAINEQHLATRIASHPNDPVDALLAPTMLENFEHLTIFDDIWLARRRETLAACAVLTTKAQTGNYPHSLPGTFLDPFTDKPFVYKLTETGFTIYSVGPHGDCDGTPKEPYGEQAIFQYPAPAPIPWPVNALSK